MDPVNMQHVIAFYNYREVLKAASHEAVIVTVGYFTARLIFETLRHALVRAFKALERR